MPITGGGAGRFPKTAISKRFFTDDETITSATLTATYTGTVKFYLSADDGSNWEEVISGTEHIFTNTGKYLKWRCLLNAGAVITRIEVEY